MMILMPKSEPIVSFTSYKCHDIFPCRTEEKPVVVKKPMPWNKAINKTRVINMLQGPILRHAWNQKRGRGYEGPSRSRVSSGAKKEIQTSKGGCGENK